MCFKRERWQSRLGQEGPWKWTIGQAGTLSCGERAQQGNNEKQASAPQMFLPSPSIGQIAVLCPCLHTLSLSMQKFSCSSSFILYTFLHFYLLFSCCHKSGNQPCVTLMLHVGNILSETASLSFVTCHLTPDWFKFWKCPLTSFIELSFVFEANS